MAANPLLQDVYRSESEEIRERFDGSHNGQATVRERSDLSDQVLTQLWSRKLAVEARSERLCVMALGGYGRRWLFPYSDVQVLFCCELESSEHSQRRLIRILCPAIWDLPQHVSPV